MHKFRHIIYGVVLCVAITPLFYFFAPNKSAKDLKILIEHCEKLNNQQKNSTPSAYQSCDPQEIRVTSDYEKSKIQKAIELASFNANSWENDWVTASIFILMFSTAPLAWGFFLKRISELSKAIRGNL